jgi:phenazine biosynthesis protein phzE
MNDNILKNIIKNKSLKNPFAFIYRPHRTNLDMVEIFEGEVTYPGLLKSVSMSASPFLKKKYSDKEYRHTLLLIPYRQISERGFACKDDGTQLISMNVSNYQELPLEDFISHCPEVEVLVSNKDFDIPDEQYADIVKRVINDEIGCGEGSNFVIKRSLTADIKDFDFNKALTIFRRLIQNETGAYWTFLINTGDHIFIGASPELHVSLDNNTMTMNPISGTYRYPSAGPTLNGILEFLAASKEADELYMVVEEELKIMALLCQQGGTIYGPYLREMSKLAHTEYFIRGETTSDPREILKQTMFAPTIIGSPLENACRVIQKYESKSRGYYSGVAALLTQDSNSQYTLDSAIMIRTADITKKGYLQIDVGATLVRHSNPYDEVAETTVKADALLNAMQLIKEIAYV